MNFKEKLTRSQIVELEKFISNPEITAIEIKRAQAILLIEQQVSEYLITTLSCLKYGTVLKLRSKFIKNGINSLKSKRPKKQPRSLLTPKMREQVINVITKENPKNHGYESDYWTTAIIADLIGTVFNVAYKSKTSIRLLFKEAKFTYHKPEKIYKNRNEEAIEKWKEENKKIIEEAWVSHDTVVLCSDEMILTSKTTTQKIWLPKGASPYIEESNKRSRKSIYGFLNIKTGEGTAFATDKQDAETTIEILKKICRKYKDCTILLIWDNAPWHRSEKMKQFLSGCSNLKLLAFPPYAPDLNPQEHVWKAARSAITHNKYIPDANMAATDVTKYINNNLFKYELLGLRASQQN